MTTKVARKPGEAKGPEAYAKEYAETIMIDALEYSMWNRERFEELRAGGVTCVHVTLAVWEDARETLSAVGEWLQLFDEHKDLVMRARSVADIHAAKKSNRTAIIFGFQNTSPFEDEINLFGVFHELGVRIVQLTYNIQNHIASGCWEKNDTGLSTVYGRDAIREMNRVGLMIDLSHCNERTCLDTIEYSLKPVALTHANPLTFVGGGVELAVRNKSDKVLKALTENGGVVGLSNYPRMAPNGENVSLQDFCDMMAWTVDLVGIEHVGIGTDIYIGREHRTSWFRTGRWSRAPKVAMRPAVKFPDWLASPAQFPNLYAGLRNTGFSQSEVGAILGGNWMRLFDQTFSPST